MTDASAFHLLLTLITKETRGRGGAPIRRQADRELGYQQGAERRCSHGLRQQAVAYWRLREAAGEQIRAVATALSIAPVSLRRRAARRLP